ncbi:VOC family protein [Thalassomonas haliotis]|uniref:VOC family protein n=1 Tax=Thalassomonas haliotis TaxID=485448 RepID=A0ABY7VID3_9GAMM|nr:VOC family protein [Thalassomonas haliotis]WDE12969.1 VOC family protein [Thalassomonas haliotis]
MLTGLHHVAIICSDYEKSKHFYTEILGLTVLAENYRQERDSYKLDLQLADGSQIELFSFKSAPERPSYPEARGLRHLAFALDDIQAFIRHLATYGIETEPVRVDEYTGKKYTFFSDPDHLPLELYQK